MALVPHQQDAPALSVVFLGLVVDAGNQRADGVYDAKVAFVGPLEILRRRTVGGEHNERTLRHFVNFLYGYRSLALQFGDHVGVVDDLVLDVHGRTEPGQALLDHVDGANHAGAESAGRTQYHFDHFYILIY